MPPLNYDPPPDRWRRLPTVLSALSESRVTRHASLLRIVMLGDSIVNDTGNSPWEVLVERQRPGLRLEVVTSVRGGTGCWFYQHEGRVKPYVLDYAPDLLMIGGISHNDDAEAIRSVIRQVRGAATWGVYDHSTPVQVCNGPAARSRAPGAQPDDRAGSARPDILLMTGPFGKDRDPRRLADWSPTIAADDGSYRSRLATLAADEGCGFLDLEGAWGAYLLATDHPYDWFLRDAGHANTRGGMLLARILERFFTTGS